MFTVSLPFPGKSVVYLAAKVIYIYIVRQIFSFLIHWNLAESGILNIIVVTSLYLVIKCYFIDTSSMLYLLGIIVSVDVELIVPTIIAGWLFSLLQHCPLFWSSTILQTTLCSFLNSKLFCCSGSQSTVCFCIF